MTSVPFNLNRRWPGPAALVARLVRRVFGPVDRPGSGYEYAQMGAAGYHHPIGPTPGEAPAYVVATVKELTDAHAVDEGNGHIFEPIVRAWGEHWCDQELRQHMARHSILQMHALNARAWHERCDSRIAQIEEELRQAETQLAELEAPVPRLRTAPRPRPPADAL